ncbi:MAG: hypothetical protein LBK56_02620 [Gracilibacteraceae bacterium]|jgi:hypothetical protein|nr:hypothetical protein [Gracilibacteraceae bacterium]
MQKSKIAMTETECRYALHALNELRNRLIAEGSYTDVVDEVIVKIVKAPIRKVKIA